MVVDKPAGLTSHDVVNRVRRLAGTRKVGHLGTLDPIATGVLPVVIGRATRLAQFFSSGDKEYDARIRFGWATDTYDRAGTPVSDPVEPHITREQLEEELAKFRGPIVQTPPPFSAKKVAGTPAYRLARKQIAVELAPVEVTIRELELLEFDGTRTRIRVRCSTGTYLRSIAHDLGQRLQCGAFLEDLRRTAAGEFSEKDARTFEELEALASAGRLSEALIPSSDVLAEFPNAKVDALTAGQIRQGQGFSCVAVSCAARGQVCEGDQSRRRADRDWGGPVAASLSSHSGAVDDRDAETHNEASLIPRSARGSVCWFMIQVCAVSCSFWLCLRRCLRRDDGAAKPKTARSEPKYTDTFAGPIVKLSAEKVTVSRSILGKPAETRTFWIKSDTRVEGKLRTKARVTVGFVTTDEGDVARLIVVRTAQRTPPGKKK